MKILRLNCIIDENYINISIKGSFFEYHKMINCSRDDIIYHKTILALLDLITSTVFDHLIIRKT